jgi:hypothetical protein
MDQTTTESLASFFAKQDQVAGKHSKGGGGNSTKYPFQLTRKNNQGMLVCRMVPDKRGVPCRVTYDLWSMWLPKMLEDNSGLDSESSWLFTLPDDSNYRTPLTPDQKELYDRVVSLMERANELGYEYMERSQIAYFYAKPIRLLKDDKTVDLASDNEPLRLFMHTSAGFYSGLSEAISLKTNSTGSNQFLPNYFSRDPNPLRNAVVISTTKKEIGFKVGVAFENLETPTGVSLTEEDLNRAEDLDMEDPVVSVFPQEQFNLARVVLEMVCQAEEAKARTSSGAVPNFNNQQYQQQQFDNSQQSAQPMNQQYPNQQVNQGQPPVYPNF